MLVTLIAPLAVAAARPTQPGMHPLLEPMSAAETAGADATESTRSCTVDMSWCVGFDPDAGSFVSISSPSGEAFRVDLEAEDEAFAGGYHRPWPNIVRLNDGALVGVETDFVTGFSGGGGQTTGLILIAIRAEGKPRIVLHVPTGGSFMIRACFSEKDMKQRAGACHDEYAFKGDLGLTGTMSDGMPVFRYTTRATSFPGHVSRSKDSLAANPLRKKDLRTVIDTGCTYERIFRFDTGSGQYQPDTPLPDCSDYTAIE